MSSILLEGGTVITFDEDAQCVVVLPNTDVLIHDGRITAIEAKIEHASLPKECEIVDVAHRIVAPGFVNTHLHSWESVWRTLGPNVTLPHYFPWFSQMGEPAKHLSAEDVYWSSLESYYEALNAGITTILEHAHNVWTPDVIWPGFEAAVDCGARVWWCYDISPSQGFPFEKQRQLLEKAVRIRPKTVEIGLALDGLSHASPLQMEQVKTMVR
jgi:cytosine/adenosine deaminase-related metal-dependent hydrolase